MVSSASEAQEMYTRIHRSTRHPGYNMTSNSRGRPTNTRQLNLYKHTLPTSEIAEVVPYQHLIKVLEGASEEPMQVTAHKAAVYCARVSSADSLVCTRELESIAHAATIRKKLPRTRSHVRRGSRLVCIPDKNGSRALSIAYYGPGFKPIGRRMTVPGILVI